MIVKRIVTASVILLVIAVLWVLGNIVWYFFLMPDTPTPINPILERTTRENVDYYAETGLVYINNEIVIMTYEGVGLFAVEALARELDAEIVTSMEDIGFYLLRFQNSMTYHEIDRRIRYLRENAIIEDAFFNALFEAKHDAQPAFEYVPADLFFPNDPWNGSTWKIDVPRGLNWGMEAISAPAAWGYLYRMEMVRVGLIDNFPNTSHADFPSRSGRAFDFANISYGTGGIFTDVRDAADIADAIFVQNAVCGIAYMRPFAGVAVRK